MTNTINYDLNILVDIPVEKLESKKRIKVLVLLALVVVVAVSALVYFKIIKNPIQNIPLLQKEPKVSIKTGYKNPFDKKTQYINPFEEYKNPFVVAK